MVVNYWILGRVRAATALQKGSCPDVDALRDDGVDAALEEVHVLLEGCLLAVGEVFLDQLQEVEERCVGESCGLECEWEELLLRVAIRAQCHRVLGPLVVGCCSRCGSRLGCTLVLGNMLGAGRGDDRDVEEVHSSPDVDLDVGEDMAAVHPIDEELLWLEHLAGWEASLQKGRDGVSDEVMSCDALPLLLVAGQSVEAGVEVVFLALPTGTRAAIAEISWVHE